MAAAHSFKWLGGAWNLAADWRDVTLGSIATVAPGSLDVVSITGGIAPMVVNGAGSAARVSTYESVLLDGQFQFGTLNVEGTLALMGAGSALSLGGLGEAGAAVASDIVLNATSLTVTGGGGSVLGSATITGRGWARLGDSATLSAGASIDANSCIEVGTGGTFWPGWLKVYTDGTLSGSGAIAANTVVTGVILSSGLRFQGLLGGLGQVRMDAAGATVGTVFQGTELVFAAPGACLSIAPGSAAAMTGTLIGFGTGEAIDLLGQAVASARYAPIDAQDGLLLLTDPSNSLIARIPLAGSAASYAASTYLVAPDGAGGSLVMDLAPPGSTTIGPGNATPHRDTWLGGTWNLAADWRDVTLGSVATVAPGSLDIVSITGGIAPMVVSGAGAAARVSTYESVLLDGQFQFGTLNIEGTLALMGAGSALSLGGLGEAGAAVASDIVLNATSLTVTGGGGSVLGSATITGRGWARLGDSATLSAGASIDANSCIEVGTGGTFWPGWLKVYTDGTLSGSGAIAANTVVTGVILSSGLRFQGLLGGLGQVRMDAAGATVGTVFQGTELVFAAPGACLSIAPGSAAAMTGTLIGFATGDAIDLLGQAVASARYAPIDAQDGLLLLTDPSNSLIARIPLAGSAASYAASTYLVAPDGAGGSLVMDLAPPGSTAIGPGNATPHRDTWLGGAWNLAADWRDVTLGSVATVAPGSLDIVSITGGIAPMVVSGAGAAARVSTYESVLLDGQFQFGTLNVEGTLALMGAGSALSLGGLGEAGAAVASDIVLNATSLTVTGGGGSVLGSATITGRGWARLGDSATLSAGASIDANSCIEVGTGGTFWPSWLKVYTDGTLSGSGAIAANTVVTGIILSSGLRFQGLLGGLGQVRMDAAGATVGTVFQGTDLVFAAPGACLSIAPGSAAAMTGTLIGFGTGDAIDLLGQAVATARYVATDAQDGILAVADASGATVARLALAGSAASYAQATFNILPDSAGGSLILEHQSSAAAAAAFTNPS